MGTLIVSTLFRSLFRIRRKKPMLSIFKSIGKALLKLLGRKAVEAAIEAAPEAVKVVKDGLKPKGK
jgi:hypothetical protein